MAGLDVLMLGQVFTPGVIVDQMLSLRRNFGRTLEPSAGAGAFSSRVPGCVAVEIDPGVAQPDALLMDFFDYPESERFDTIIGNPPYVAARGIRAETRERLQCDLFDGRSNLYLYFVEKCVRHLNPGGELIFITPRDWPKLTAARKMNVWLAEQGSITHFIETGDSRVFQGATPNCAIWRFEKGRTARILEDGRVMVERDGQLLFLKGRYSQPLGDLFEVKVGAVSGANEVFVHPHGNVEFVCSSTLATGETRRAWWGVKNAYLEGHKQRLLSRGIRAFDESNWWEWGRSHHISDRPRIYVNAKTRRDCPFFHHPCPHYDGTVLALFPKDPGMDIGQAIELLNAADWDDLGFVCDGRFLFSQRSLQTTLLPEAFGELQGRRRKEVVV